MGFRKVTSWCQWIYWFERGMKNFHVLREIFHILIWMSVLEGFTCKGHKWKQWQTLFPWAPESLQKVTVPMKLKRCLLLGRKAMTNLDGVFKSRNITFLTKFRIVKAMIFPVVMYGCKSGTIKKTERRRIDAFELWCCRRLLRVLWTAKRSNQSILKEIKLSTSPGSSKKQERSWKNIFFCFIDPAKAFDRVDHNKRKILKEMVIPDHLTHLLRSMCRSGSNS